MFLINSRNRCFMAFFSSTNKICKLNCTNNKFCKRLTIENTSHTSTNLLNKFFFSQSVNATFDNLTPVHTNSENKLTTLIERISSSLTVKNRAYGKDMLHVMSLIGPDNSLSHKEILMLIKCCSNLLVDKSPKERILLLNQLLKSLGSPKQDLDYYNEILKCYIDNNYEFSAKEFLERMKLVEPSKLTYELLLSAMCKIGSMQQATEIVQIMENRGLKISEAIYNSLIEGYGKQQNISSALQIVDILKLKTNTLSIESEKSILLAFICNQSIDLVKSRLSYLVDHKIQFSNDQVLDIIQYLCQNNLDYMIPEILPFLSPQKCISTSSKMHYVCTQLIHQGFINSAFSIYYHVHNVMGPSDNINICLNNLMKEVIKADSIPENIDDIFGNVLEILKDDSFLYFGLKEAMKLRKTNFVLYFMEILKKRELPIRCHFFWPLLVSPTKENRETEIYEILSTMQKFNVHPDSETFFDYVFPNINISDPNNIIENLKVLNIPFSIYFTSMVHHLLKLGKTKMASDLCELGEGHLDCEKLIFPLIHAFLSTYDVDATHNMLKSFCIKPMIADYDWIGRFLVCLLSHRNWKTDYKYFDDLIKALNDSETRLSIKSVEKCISLTNKNHMDIDEFSSIRINLSSMLSENSPRYDFEDLNDSKYPNVNELEDCVSNLETKKLDTRNTSKKLFFRHCQLGNLHEAENIIKKLTNEKVFISSGMKASMMYLYVKTNDFQNAEKYFENLKITEPAFKLDEHKLLDYCTLLVNNNKLHIVLNILEKVTENKVIGNYSIEMNSWLLLNTIATKYGPIETKKTFSILMRSGLCKASNIILGPLIRAYLNRDDIKGAINEFIDCSNKYRKTPLKHELLCILVRKSSSHNLNEEEIALSAQIRSDYKELLIKVQECEKKTHGVLSSRISLICALADTGLKIPLRRFVLDPSIKFNQSDLIKQCSRFADEKNILALETLGECLEGIPNIQRNEIYDFIVKVNVKNEDCDGIINTFKLMNDQKIKPTNFSLKALNSMLKSHDKELPLEFKKYM